MADRRGAPAIKGSVLKAIVEHAREVVLRPAIPAAELERRFGADVHILHAEIIATSWYPMTFYGPLRQLMRDAEGHGRDKYTIDSAAEVARKLITSGLYPQLDYLKQWKEHVPLEDPRADARARRELFEQQLGRVSTIYNSLFNFAKTQIRPDPEFGERLQLEYRDGGVMPHDGRLAVLGFWLEMSLHWSPTRRGDLWTKVDARDHYILRMTRDVPDL